MAEFKLGRLRFVWKNTWTVSTAYVRDDIIRYGGKAYVCIASHTSSSNVSGGFYTDFAANRWEIMNDGIQWAQSWATATFYKLSDVVKYGGRAYICITAHTSAATTTLGLEQDSAKWEILVDGIAFSGAWSSAVRYKVNDIVSYGGQLYLCSTFHTSISSFEPANWTLFASGLQFEGAYDNAVSYQPGDVVTYGANTYVAVQTTIGNLPTDPTNWTPITSGIQFRSTYSSGTAYRKGDIVSYGGHAFVAKQDTTGNVPDNATYWDTLVPGFKYNSTYANGTTYNIGDVAQYGGYNYVAKQTTTGNSPVNVTYWDILTKGYTYVGAYNSSTTYKPGELVDYGGSIYAAKTDVATNENPSDTAKWDLFAKGFEFQGTWTAVPAQAYVQGDLVRYGGHVYVNILTTSSELPTNPTYWSKFVDGITFIGTYADATAYKPGEVVRYGGRAYICILGHTSSNASNIEPPNATYWELLTSGMKWMGPWSGSTEYELDDVVSYLQSSYISIVSDNLNLDPVTNTSAWQLVAQTGDLGPVLTSTGDTYFRNSVGAVARLPIGTNGQMLIVSPAGIPSYENNNQTANVYYVTPEGSNSNDGRSLNRAFASIRYACSQVTGPATILVKSGTYQELLPIIVPEFVSIVGDGIRTTTVTPSSGTSADGSTANNRSTMFLLSDGSMVSRLTVSGMTGFVKNVTTPEVIESATIGGVFFGFYDGSPVLTKSPYVSDVTCFSTGGIGALVDGGVHTIGNKSMIFNNFTSINDNGVGIWVRHAAKSELVSVFSYYCTFGLASSDGGQIRSLNGNNSYGTYGASSEGFDDAEVPVTGALYGQSMLYTSPAGGSFSPGQTITGAVSNATATVLNVQESFDRIYLKVTSGTFQVGEEFSNGAGVTANVGAGAVTGQSGFVLILDGITAEPRAGASITIAGDPLPYIIQTVGDYSASASTYKPAGYALLVLTTEKLTASAEDAAIVLRYRFSTVRLTGHDFLSVGTGGQSTTNYPGTPTQPASQLNEVIETYPGRVYYVSTDQDGNFRVGDYFKVDQATGKATLNASAFDLSGLTSLRLGAIGAQLGELINEFSSDTTLGGNSNSAVPTEAAVKSYVDTNNTQTNVNAIAYSVALGG